MAGGGGSTLSGYLDGLGTAARFYNPCSVAANNVGVLYVGDTGYGYIRKITASGKYC